MTMMMTLLVMMICVSFTEITVFKEYNNKYVSLFTFSFFVKFLSKTYKK